MTNPSDLPDHGARTEAPTCAAEIAKIRADAEDIGFRKEAVLRKLGWKHSSSYPDCCWRWSKIINGQTITDGTDGAFRLAAYLAAEDETE